MGTHVSPPEDARVHWQGPTTTRRVLSVWWPLAGSWLLMGLEMPAFVAAASRLPDAETNLAAFNSLVYPISMVVEGPIVMLLAASTALVRDRRSYDQLRRFTITAGLALTLVHAIVAFTPIYDWIARDLIDVSEAALEPGRLGLRIMLPWSGAIAFRRFQQGVLIRYGRPRAVVVGTIVRLVSVSGVLLVGVAHGAIHGVVVGASAIATGVIAEAVFASWATRRVLREDVPSSGSEHEPLTARGFLAFYVPLALTPLMTLALQPITAAALWRMPDALRSSASWSAVYGFVFLFRALGFAFQEVTVSLLHTEDGARALRRFATILGLSATAIFVVFACTPLASVWFEHALALPPPLALLARAALPLGAMMPLLATLQNHCQGRLVATRRTRAITEAVVLYVATACLLFVLATTWWPHAGIHAALLVLAAAGSVQLGWLWLQARATAGIITPT
ncbi:MAG: hypothetical protein KDB80_07445 [Planctomycetes bacterium]|nr:hypothetical protein [Planctomycetota bacterium]